jgi:hypothetical protein
MPDTPHVLCVNPWIHDFAAFDFWLKPLGLLGLAALLRNAGIRVSFIDCLDRFHPKEPRPVKTAWDGRGPFRKTPIHLAQALPAMDGPLPRIEKTFSRYGIKPEWFKTDLTSLDRPDLILVTSLMTYWASGAKETIAVIRSVYPDVPVVLGGKYPTLCRDHAQAHSGADLVDSRPWRTGPGGYCQTVYRICLPPGFPGSGPRPVCRPGPVHRPDLRPLADRPGMPVCLRLLRRFFS